MAWYQPWKGLKPAFDKFQSGMKSLSAGTRQVRAELPPAQTQPGLPPAQGRASLPSTQQPSYSPSGQTPFGPASGPSYYQPPRQPQAPAPGQYGTSQYGSMSFDPTYMLPGGGTYSAARPPGATGIQGSSWQFPQGSLSTPGYAEDWYEKNKDRLGRPTEGMGVMKEATDFFRGPNRTAGYVDRVGSMFEKPGMGEGYAQRALPGIEGRKSHTEQLYESGNKGLNTFYDRERDKRQKRLEDQMSAMGVFGSGATAKSMFELEAELGAQQARDMAGLATSADAAWRDRIGLGADISKMGQDLGQGRATAGGALQNLADSSVDRQARGLFDAGQGMDAAELDRDRGVFGFAERAQTAGERRKRYPIEDAKDIAGAKSGISERGTTRSTDEQGQIKTSIIDAIMASGAVDADEAEQLAEGIMNGTANMTRLAQLGFA